MRVCEINKANHGDAYYIAASPSFRSRACWLALNAYGSSEMTEKRFKDKKSLKDWLVSASGIALTSISLMGSVQDLEFKFSNPDQLLTVMKGAPEYFPDGEYLVTFKNSDSLDHDSLDYSKMAMGVAFEAKMARHNTLIGGLNPLLEALADFEYCCTIDKTSCAYTTAGIWVIEPIF